MLKHLNRIGVALLLYVAVTYIYSSARQKDFQVVQHHSFDPEAFQAVDWFPGPGLSSEEKQAYFAGIQHRIKKLTEMERERSRRERAASGMAAARREAQAGSRMAWGGVIRSNVEKFNQLREIAQKTPRGQTPCTICDGLSYMPCVMCKNHDGKCSSCNGTGHKTMQEYCATCGGTGKCYLCAGSKKMFCPFCDDGMIDVHWPAPENYPPQY